MKSAWLLFCMGLWMFAGCRETSPPVQSSASKAAMSAVERTGPIQVTATVGMVADLVRMVGGDRVQVTQICGTGVDPHLYKVTRDDVRTLMQADIIFYAGLMLEGKMTDTLVKLGQGKPVIAVSESIDKALLLEPDDFAGHHDPHVWMDVPAWSNCVPVVAEALLQLDPGNEAGYRERAAEYQAQLAQLDSYGLHVLASIPIESRMLVTSHDAFNYFGRAYGLQVLGVQGISTESEAGLQRINELVDLLVNRRIRTVFVESSVPRKNIDSLMEGARSRGHEVQVAAKELFSDAMGAAGTYEGTYIGMLDHNFTLVARGLGGVAPETGLHGKLAP